MEKLVRVLFAVLFLSVAASAQIDPGSKGHGQPTFNCAINETYGDLDTGLVWKCYTQPAGWAPTPYFQPWGTVSTGGASLITPNPQAFNGPITAGTINGDVVVDGTVNPTINAAWTACQNTATNCALQVPAGTFPLTSTLAEPEAAYSTSIFGRGSDKTIIKATAAMTTMLLKGNATIGSAFVIQGVTFQCNNGTTINAQNGVKLQRVRGVILSDVHVINCGTLDIDFGEDAPATNQFGGTFKDLFTDYNEGVFTGPAGGGGPTPPDFSVQLRATAGDSVFRGMVLRNAHTASLHVDGGNVVFSDVHGFGFSATNYLSYIPAYIIEENGTGNTYYGTYFDSPGVAAIHFVTTTANAVTNDIFEGGIFYWNTSPNGSPVTYPATDSLIQFDGANVGDWAMKDFSCFKLPNTSSPFTGTGTTGVRVRFDNITGCSTTFMTYVMSPQNRGYNWSDIGASFPFQWQGTEGHYAKTANGTDTWQWLDSAKVARAKMSDDGNFKPPKLTINGGQTMTNPPEMMAYLGTIAPATLNNTTVAPFVPINPVTITRVEWQTATECTVAATLTVSLTGTLQSYTIPITTTAFSGHTDGTLNVPAGSAVGLKTTTAGTTCGVTQINIHYLMQ